MTIDSSTIISPELYKCLAAFHGESTEHAQLETSDTEIVLTRIKECGRFSAAGELEEAVDAYIAGKPLAYITGSHKFGDLILTVRPPVYIPRIETEQWVILLGNLVHKTITSAEGASPSALRFTRDRPFRILDICSGSGCIPLLLAHIGSGLIHTVGLEVDPRALAVARENTARNGLEAVARFEEFDLFDDTPEGMLDLKKRIGAKGRQGFGFDMVVSNPPYVSSEDMKKVETTWHEGRFALQGKLQDPHASKAGAGTVKSPTDGSSSVNDIDDQTTMDGDDGYTFYRRIRSLYSSFLDTSSGDLSALPKLVLEVGATQSGPVQEMYAGEGRLEVQRESARRKEIGAPKLEDGDMVGTERSIWVYRD